MMDEKKEESQKIYEICGQKMSKEEYEESMANLVGFFNLLFQIDRRNNPERYIKPKNRLEN